MGAQGGFGNNPNSLAGATQGLGRFYFDGNGSIVGTLPSSSTSNMPIGAYTVNDDCSATMSLTSGQSYAAVVAQRGSQILFIETDSSGAGSAGTLLRALQGCGSIALPETFAFNFSGAQPNSSSASSGSGSGSGSGGGSGSGSGGGTGSTAAVAYAPYAGVGSITLESSGFTMNLWAYQNGSVQPFITSGTYTIGPNCAVQLMFTQPAAGATGTAAFMPPTAFNGLLVTNSTGVVTLQTTNNAVITGQLLAQ